MKRRETEWFNENRPTGLLYIPFQRRDEQKGLIYQTSQGNCCGSHWERTGNLQIEVVLLKKGNQNKQMHNEQTRRHPNHFQRTVCVCVCVHDPKSISWINIDGRTKHSYEQLTSVCHAESSNIISNFLVGLSNFIGNSTVMSARVLSSVTAFEGTVLSGASRSLNVWKFLRSRCWSDVSLVRLSLSFNWHALSVQYLFHCKCKDLPDLELLGSFEWGQPNWFIKLGIWNVHIHAFSKKRNLYE